MAATRDGQDAVFIHAQSDDQLLVSLGELPLGRRQSLRPVQTAHPRVADHRQGDGAVRPDDLLAGQVDPSGELQLSKTSTDPTRALQRVGREVMRPATQHACKVAYPVGFHVLNRKFHGRSENGRP